MMACDYQGQITKRHWGFCLILSWSTCSGESQLPGHEDPQAVHGGAGLVRNQGLLPRGVCVLLGKFSNLRMTVASTALTVVCSFYFNCICNKILPNKTEITLIKNNSNQHKIRYAKGNLKFLQLIYFKISKEKFQCSCSSQSLNQLKNCIDDESIPTIINDGAI